MKNKFFILCLSLFVFLNSCKDEGNLKVTEKTTVAENTTAQQTNQAKEGVLIENIQGSKYTYLKLKSGDKEKWFAVAKAEVQNGTKYYYEGEMEMQNFHSKELNRTFETIYFLNSVRTSPTATAGTETVNNNSHETVNPVLSDLKVNEHTSNLVKSEVKIEPVKGGITVGELFKNRTKYSGKSITIRGKVVKFNADIMGKNWVHIQDGTADAENFDLTVTTSEIVKVDDIVTFAGTITLNKDFGAGYSYAVIMEGAVKK